MHACGRILLTQVGIKFLIEEDSGTNPVLPTYVGIKLIFCCLSHFNLVYLSGTDFKGSEKV
jgi:hypothetical protein